MKLNKEERWHSTDAFVAACTAAAKITETTGGMVATIYEMNTFQELLKQQGFSILPIEYANQDKWINVKDELPKEMDNWKFLVSNEEDQWTDAAYFENGEWHNGECEIIPTHWQMLPTPPKQ
jgi:hypothetical protein